MSYLTITILYKLICCRKICFTFQGSYVSVEAHYMDNDCNIKRVTLSNEPLESKPTADNICDTVQEVLSEWNLDDKVEAIVHDSASTMQAVGRKMNNIPNRYIHYRIA